MARGETLKAGLLARLHDAGLSITVHYPVARPSVSGTAPGTSVVSPLTGVAPTLGIVVGDPTPSADPVTIDCLWFDASTGVLSSIKRTGAIDLTGVGWTAGADAMATVDVQDAALDPDDPYGDTIFTGAEVVEFAGRRYRVMGVTPNHASFLSPYVYYVWVQGATKATV